MSERSFYAAPVHEFLADDAANILGRITSRHSQNLLHQQTLVWAAQISLLKGQLKLLIENEAHIFSSL